MQKNNNADVPNQFLRSQSAKNMGSRVQTEQLSAFKQKVNNLVEDSGNKNNSSVKCPPLNFKTIKSLTNNEELEIFPKEVLFKDIEMNQTYEMSIFIQNLAKVPKRIKILQPKTSKFRVDYDAQGSIAAGLSMKLVVTFETLNVVDDFSDTIQILYEKNGKKATIDLKLNALKPQSELEFDTYINFGFVKIHRDHQYKFLIKNNGKTPGKVKLNFEHLNNIKCEPQTFIIEPNKQFPVMVTYNPKDASIFRGNIEVILDGTTLTKNIDVNATGVDFNIFVIDHKGTKTENFDFSDLYFGQKRVLKGFLVNNTPKDCNFKVQMRVGDIRMNMDEGQIQTPIEQGLEMTEQIMKCLPLKGQLKAYSQIPISFTCQSRVDARNQASVKKYAMMEKQIQKGGYEKDFVQETQEYIYTAIFDLDNDEEPIIMTLQAKAVHPQIKLDKQLIDFGECAVNDNRDSIFYIENHHKSLPIDIDILRIPQFKVSPNQIVLDPFQQTSFVTTFTPINVGRYSQNIEITLLNGQYKIPLKVKGATSSVDKKRPKTRGVECIPKDFVQENKYIDLQNKNIYHKKNNMELLDEAQSQFQHHKDVINPDLLEQRREMIDELKKKKENEQKYINAIRNQKDSRVLKEKDRILKFRVKEMEDRLKEQGKTLFQNGDEEDQDKAIAPYDLEWEVKVQDQNIEEPFLELPETKERLFVLKPIGIYEPISSEENKHFHPEPNQPAKKYFQERPTTHKDVRDVHLELSGEDLQKIFAGPKIIDFGSINVKSKCVKSFTVKNDLRNSIKVQLQSNCQELSECFLKPQIIPSSETAKFNIVLCSQGLDDNFRQVVKYIINGKHEFEFEVRAKIQQVKLDIEQEKQTLKFQFSDDSDKMETSETIKLSNNGNAPAVFRWISDSKTFTVDPIEDMIPNGSSKICKITYRPTPSVEKPQKEGQAGGGSGGNQPRNEYEKLQLTVQDGTDQIIQCIGQVHEARCQLKQTSMELGEILVWKEETKFFSIKNNSKIHAVFQVIQEALPHHCDVYPAFGRIAPDATIDLTVKYSNPEERDVQDEIAIMIRGGKILKLPFLVKTVVPRVEIKEPEFNFGKITLGNNGVLTMTLINYSNIAAELQLDMRSEEENPDSVDGIECLQIIPIDDGDESILKSMNQDIMDEEEVKNNNKNVDVDEDIDQEDSGSDEGDNDNHTSKQYLITIGPNQTLKFELRFSAKDVKPYNFDIPITLYRYGKLSGLNRQIVCRGMKPKFLVEPPLIEFARKIITNAEKMYPQTLDVTLSNPEKTEIKWRLCEMALKDDKLFQIHPQKGRVDPGQTLRIKASFNPQVPGYYEKIVPLYIDDPDMPADKPCLEIKLKGESQFPKLLFDRNEILLPVVPLNVMSKCQFKIHNDGYDNLSLNYRIHEDLGNLNITCSFPEGKTLGVGKNKVKVEACFISKTPISFSTKIVFLDEQGHTYTIPISGTADNSLFTNFAYLQRHKGDYKIEYDDKKGAIQILESEQNDDISDAGSQTTHRKKYAGSVGSGKTLSSKSSQKSGLGYTPIPKEKLEQSKESIKNWLNGNVLLNNIQTFPESIVEQGGTQLFELLLFLAGAKNTNQYKANIEKNMKKSEKALLYYQQYDNLIRFLKMEGAYLNHIRPQYLLSFAEFYSYIKQIPKEEKQFTHPNAIKMSYQRFLYMHVDAWISIFYQILKLYYLQRITNKIFKTIPNINQEKTFLPPQSYLEHSNIYSSFEGILLRWLEHNYELVYQSKDTIQQQTALSPKPLTNFESDISDGHMVAALITNYLQPLTENLKKVLQNMKQKCNNEDECMMNSNKVMQALQEIRLHTTFASNDIAKPSGREIILFLIQLYNALPNYVSKGQPIIFSCTLGEEVIKTIELTNPTTKPISYWVKYDGSSDFKPEFEDCFKIEARQTFKFKVKFVSRVSKAQTGRITFTNKKESNVQAAALVFELKSQISGRISSKYQPVSTNLYESLPFEVEVENTFQNSDFGEFWISVIHEQELPKKKLVVQENQKKKTGKPQQYKKKQQEVEKEVEIPFYPCFFCKQDRIKLKRKAKTHIQMSFIPMVYENQRCYIIFADPNVGEFQYEIIGEVKAPSEVIDIPRFQIAPPIFVDEQRSWPLSLEFKNLNIVKAKNEVEKQMVDMRNKKGKDFKYQLPKLGNLEQIVFDVDIQQGPSQSVIVPKQVVIQNPKFLAAKKDPQNESGKNKIPKLNNQLNTESNQENKLEVSYQSKQSKNFYDGTGGSQQEIQNDQQNFLPFNFHFKNPIINYEADITLKNQDKTDIRRYKLRVTSYPKPVKAILEMTCSARERVIQEIPIVNNTERDWHIKVILSGTEENCFSSFRVTNLPQDPTEPLGKDFKDFLVKKKSTGNIPIIFNPDWICNAEAKLVLQNNLTNDVFEYELRGVAEEPLAEDHIVINCQARTTTKKDIIIKNPSFNAEQGLTYNVDTDLIGASGSPTLVIPPKSKSKPYTLSITPVLSGQYTGSITFTDADGKYIWYTVLLNTESPPADRVLDLNAGLRKAIACDIDLRNPLQETITFEVLIEGDGLLGEQYIQIPPGEQQVYELIYMPLKVGKFKGSIAFVSERLGEIWYELNLICEESTAIRLPMLKCELGKQEQHEIMLENPSGSEQKIRLINSNPQNYDVQPENISIPPYDVCYVHVTYMPSVLDQVQTVDLIFDSDEIGKWHYLCFGMGVPPTEYEAKTVTVGLNKDISSVIHFKNPFKDPINVKIFLDVQDQQVIDVLKLLTKNLKEEAKIQVSGNSSIQIPFTFTPTEIRQYKATLIVSMNDKISWKYPILGITESYSSGVLKIFKTKCRQPLESDLEINLPGISHLHGHNDTFQFELRNVNPPNLKTNLDKYFQVREFKDYLENINDSLKLKISFNPMKPFKCTADLVIMRKLGGLWKFKLIMEATPPNEDDVIIISSPLHHTTTVTFRLTNRKPKVFATFNAKYTPESDAEFAIQPKSGLLEPFGTDGTQFMISFTPVEYGKTRTAKLIIETEDMYWSYGIRGILPKYNPPNVLESKIANKLEEEVKEHLDVQKKKNYMANNIKALRDQSPPYQKYNTTQLQQQKRSSNASPTGADNRSHISGKSKQTMQSRLFSAKTQKTNKTQMKNNI